MSTKKSPPRLPKVPRKDELVDLLASVKSLRNQAMIQVMIGCGLRVSETCNLTLDQINWSTDTPFLRFHGKRGKERVIPLNLEVQDTLRRWLKVRGTNGSPFLFPSLRAGGRLDRRAVWKMLARACKRAGLPHLHPHMLRHHFGTSLADKGIPIERIRELMGHASITTSQIYITVSAEQKKSAVEKIDRRPRVLRWWSRIRNKHFRFFPLPSHPHVAGRPRTVGRVEELRRLQENVAKGVDTLLIGPIGTGKSHLLDLLQGENIIRMKSLSPVKEAVIALAEELHRHGLLKFETSVQDEKS